MRRPPKYNRTKAVKAIARKRVGSPPPARILDEKPIRKKPKHKKHWTDED
jgi:hypothetical protein